LLQKPVCITLPPFQGKRSALALGFVRIQLLRCFSFSSFIVGQKALLNNQIN